MTSPPVSHDLNRQTLVQQITQSLLRQVIQMEVGAPLSSVGDLAESFEASRPVIREALSALDALGLIERHNGKPTVVRELDFRLVQLFLTRASRLDRLTDAALMEVRIPLEVQAARLAAERRTTTQLHAMDKLLARMASSLHSPETYPILDVEFHAAVAEAAGNIALLAFTQTLRLELVGMMRSVRAIRERERRVGTEQSAHEAIVTAVRAGDGDGAADAMHQHLVETNGLIAKRNAVDE